MGGELNIIWNIRRPASIEKEKVLEEVLVGFAAESWRCPRPRDTWWVPTLPLPWFSTMVQKKLTSTRSYLTVWSVCLGLTLKRKIDSTIWGLKKKPNLGMIGPSSRRRRGLGRGSASGREWRSGEATGGSGVTPG